MKNKKGISPLIAVIMLIAFTLVVAGILAAWATQFAQTQRSVVQRCVNARVIISSGTYNTDAKNLTLVIYNYGKIDLAFIALLEYTNLTAHPTGTEKYGPILNVSAGDIKMFTIEGVTPDLKQINIQSTDCDPPCYHCPGAQDMLLDVDINGLRA